MVDAAIFELEGVLFDTGTLRRESLRSAMLTHGIDTALDPDVVDALPPRAAACAALSRARPAHDDVLLDLVALGAERLFSSMLAAAGAELREGARCFIERASSSARVAIVTRARRSDAESLLRLAGLEAVASIMVCGDDLLDAKPSPAGHHVALDRLGRQRPVRRSTIVALEDGACGIRAVHAAGLRCVASGPIAPHVAMEADAYVPTLLGHTLMSVHARLASHGERVQ